MDASFHIENLSNHCRICATAFPRGYKDKKDKRDIVDLVMKCYNTDVISEDELVYPQYICLKCYAQMCRIAEAKGNRYIHPSLTLYKWQPHTSSCEVCQHFCQSKKGGWPRKGRKNRGRTAGETVSQTVANVQEVAGEKLVTVTLLKTRCKQTPLVGCNQTLT